MPFFIPAIISMVLGLLSRVLASRLGMILFSIGLSAVTYTGVSVGLGVLKQDVIGYLTALPPTMISVLSLMRIDQGMLILFSALAGRIGISAVNGAVTRFVHRQPGT